MIIMLLLVGLYSCYLAGFRINISESMPLGIWRVEQVRWPLKRGDIVWFCPLENNTFKLAIKRLYIPQGVCPNGASYLLKPVAAITGDIVVVTSSGISVNGTMIQYSKPYTYDSLHRLLPQSKRGTFRVSRGTVWLISSYNQKSFDSRYFGPVQENVIQQLAYPVLVSAK